MVMTVVVADNEVKAHHGRTVYFYFFVNAGSGGKKAPLLLGLEIHEIDFQNFVGRNGPLEDLETIAVKICPLNDAQQKAKRFRELKELADTHSSPRTYQLTTDTLNVYAIACGGDGTTIWVIEELIKAKVNMRNVVVGLMPLGTGNDLSIATGFGRRIF